MLTINEKGKKKGTLRKEILALVAHYYQTEHNSKQPFVAGKSKISYAGRIYDEKELVNLVDSCLDFWLTAGRYVEKFEDVFAAKFGQKYCSMTNSGSSANLLAISALTSPKIKGKLSAGDEVITAAAGFPTTVNPIFQLGLVPVFVDVEIGTYNVDPKIVEEAISEKTKAIFLAHTLGNPFDAEAIAKIALKHNLWLIEDCCDALASTINNRFVGTFGHLSTYSFYPAHHITTGEGGAVLTNDSLLRKEVNSFRDWGRDCWCAPGSDDTCKKRFDWKLGDLPYGYDHKYIYSNIGFNLKALEMQGAIGLAQLEKLNTFVEKRRDNYAFFMNHLHKYEHKLVLPMTSAKAVISPFGFMLTVRSDAGFTRNQLVGFLEQSGIATRMLFGGNLTRQPAYIGKKYRVHGTLQGSDTVMNNSFWIGVYPGITSEMRTYIIERFEHFMQLHS
jgi:CDP-4-dehydro-6-deoxyglucose reductase, E1